MNVGSQLSATVCDGGGSFQASPVPGARLPLEAQYAPGRQGIYDQDNAGTFTPETEQAVKTFQAAHQMPADGVVNAATWAALITADCH